MNKNTHETIRKEYISSICLLWLMAMQVTPFASKAMQSCTKNGWSPRPLYPSNV